MVYPRRVKIILALALVVAAVALLALVPKLINAIARKVEKRRPLTEAERAQVALAGHYAVLNRMSDEDLAGFPPGRRQAIWSSLARDWDIKGLPARKHALAIQTLDWLRDEGDRANPDRVAGDPARETALFAWDFSRLVHLARLCFFAGYIDEETAWTYIRAAGRNLAARFDGWPAYGRAILVGREIWAGRPSPEVAGAIDRLLASPDSAWQKYAWPDVGDAAKK
jgi:Protein of unknown function (DUF1266)